MQSFYLAGKVYLLDDKGCVLIAAPHRRKPSIDPQLALQRARLVFERTLADPNGQFGGYAMAKFTTEQHIQGHYVGKCRCARLSPVALQKLRATVAAW